MFDFAIDPLILDRFERLGVALAVGLLMGIERGWKERGEPSGARTAGIRTFPLIGLLGGALGLVSQELGGIVLAAGFLGFAGVMGAFELRAARRGATLDATPIVAALVAFALGALAAQGYLRVAAAAAVAATILLAIKQSLHAWLERVSFEELRAGLLLAAMTAILLPLLPSEPIDPWGALNPRSVWLMTILIAGVSFVGYAAIRIVGGEKGPLLAGAAGGVVSSTATTLSFARLARDGGAAADSIVAGVVAANAVMFARMWLVASALRGEMTLGLAAGLAPPAIVSAGLAAALAWRARRNADRSAATEAVLQQRNPLDLAMALQFGVLLALVSLTAAGLERLFGAQGVYALAAVAGLADVDAITLSMARSTGPAVDVAVAAILIAMAVNTASKAALAWIAGGARVGRVVAATSAVALLAAGAGYAAFLRFG